MHAGKCDVLGSIVFFGRRCAVAASLMIFLGGVVAAFSYPQEALSYSTVTSGTFGEGAALLLVLCLRCRCRHYHHCHPLPVVVHLCHPGLLLRGSYHWPAGWVLCVLTLQDLSSSSSAALVLGMLPAAFIRRCCICGRRFIGSPGRITSTIF